MRRPQQLATAGLLALCLLGLFGCSEATDGGVPLGRPPLTGQVVLASAPLQPVAGATLTLQDASNQVSSWQTDATGSYTFPAVAPGPATLTVTPPTGSSLAPQILTLTISGDATRSVVAALAPAAQYAAVTAVQLQPSSLNLTVGQSVPLQASVQGPGVAPGSTPSLVVSGGVGQVLPGGQFTATHPGSGAITARFGPASTSIPVLVH